MPTPANDPRDPAPDYRPLLNELVELGMELARTIHADVQSGKTDAIAAVPAFERVARCIRRTILLAQRCGLADPLQSPQRRAAARRQILREVENAIDRGAATDAENARLHDELDERIDGPDILEDLGNRPTADIIADICRDLGIAAPPGLHPWKRRTPADIAALCARAAAEPYMSSPLPPAKENPLPPGEGRVRALHKAQLE